jgi:hypothetical protein
VLASCAGLYGCSGGTGAPDPVSASPPDAGGTPPSPPPPASPGKVTLNWARPTTNEDGSALTDLSGYKVYYGQAAYGLDHSVDVHGASLTSVEIGGLTQGTWYFAIASYNSSGVESSKSGVVSTTL